LTKCFFSSYYANLSFRQEGYLFLFGDITFKSDINTVLSADSDQCFWLKMECRNYKHVGYGLIHVDQKVFSDPTVMSPEVLTKLRKQQQEI
jgi:hypothetical protein